MLYRLSRMDLTFTQDTKVCVALLPNKQCLPLFEPINHVSSHCRHDLYFHFSAWNHFFPNICDYSSIL